MPAAGRPAFAAAAVAAAAGQAKMAAAEPVRVDHTWMAPPWSREATYFEFAGRACTALTLASCPVYCTPVGASGYVSLGCVQGLQLCAGVQVHCYGLAGLERTSSTV